MDTLEHFMEEEHASTSIHKAAKVCYKKLQEYYCKTDNSPIPMVAFSKFVFFFKKKKM
jgi:hypothetical protein